MPSARSRPAEEDFDGQRRAIPTAGKRKPDALWPTASGPTILFLACLYLIRSTESAMVTGMAALLSMLVTVVGIFAHGLFGLWRAFKGGGGLPSRSLARAAMYLLFGVASLTAARLQGNTVQEFRDDLHPGMSLHEGLRRLDAVYLAHPKQWRFVSLWGTAKELTLDDYRRVGKSGEGTVTFIWRAGEARSIGALKDTDDALAKTRQVWFTFRGDVGFVHFFVVLDERGLIKSVSETTGHQA